MRNAAAFSSTGLFLLTSLCFIFGMEVAYKVATKQLIWLFNPCHVTSMVQIYLLTSEATAFTNKVFQIMLHTIHGPLAALLFPTTESLILPFEPEVYWIQHILIIIIPFYLMSSYAPSRYHAHSPLQMDIYTQAFLAWSLYHWIVMQGISYLTLANVGSMLCAAVSDPLSGPDYRLYGIIHQSLAIFMFGTAMAIIARGSLFSSTECKKED